MNLFKKILLFTVFTICSINNFAQNLPPRPTPVKFVNDYTNTLTPDQIQGIEQKLFQLAKNTSTEIVVVIVNSTDGVTISDYNLDLLRTWQVGSKKNNNGVVLLIAKKDRKLDISVGYGLEGALTDATSLSIIEDVILPKFKGEDYYRGVADGVDAIVLATQGKYNEKREPSSNEEGGGILIFFFIALIILLIFARKGGGNGGAYMSRRGQRGIADAIFWNTVLGGGGGSGWSGGGGGGWSGGGGGGFGSFGGGSGGGGGASGSW